MSDLDPLFPRHANSGPAPEVTPDEDAQWALLARACWECGAIRPADDDDGGNEWFCAHCREVYP